MSVKLYSNVNVLEVGDALTDFEDGYSVYDARYVLKDGDTMTGALMVDGSADVAQLRVQGTSGQTANLQTWEGSDGTVLTQVERNGALRIGTIYGDQTIKLGLGNTYPFELAHSDLPGLELFHVDGTKYVPADDGGMQQYGANFNFGVNVSSGKATGGVTGFSAHVTNAGAGLAQGLTGASYFLVNYGSNYDGIGLAAGIVNQSGAAMQRAYGIKIQYVLNSGTLNDVYGIYLPDINAGDTKNYSIFTQAGDVALMASGADRIGFHGATPVAQQTVTGSRGGNAALASLLTKLANLGLVIDSST